MSKFFIHRPIFAIVVSLIIVIVGAISATQLPIAQYPQISPPTISVSTNYTGASAAVVNDTVAQIIEQQVNGTQGMDYMSSNSDDTGRYSLGAEQRSDGDAFPAVRSPAGRRHDAKILERHGVYAVALL